MRRKARDVYKRLKATAARVFVWRIVRRGGYKIVEILRAKALDR
jgi:hypothetical protein